MKKNYLKLRKKKTAKDYYGKEYYYDRLVIGRLARYFIVHFSGPLLKCANQHRHYIQLHI